MDTAQRRIVRLAVAVVCALVAVSCSAGGTPNLTPTARALLTPGRSDGAPIPAESPASHASPDEPRIIALKHVASACLQMDYPPDWFVAEASFAHGSDLVIVQSFMPDQTGGLDHIPPGTTKIDLMAAPLDGRVTLQPTGPVIQTVPVVIEGIRQQVEILDVQYRVNPPASLYEGRLTIAHGGVRVTADVYATTAADAEFGAHLLATLHACSHLPA